MSSRAELKSRALPGEEGETERLGSKSALREYAEAICLAVILALFIRTFVVQAFKIPSGSMEPTLLVGDHILVVKSVYGLRAPFTNEVLVPFKKPQRGEVIVFVYPQDPRKDFIKRVVAVGGDTVEIRKKRLYINGRPVRDEHARYTDPELAGILVSPKDEFGPVKVPEGQLFMMGDNRDHSHDSRFWGFVDERAVRGQALVIYWSKGAEGFLGVRWNRLFSKVS
ncbi:MAG: signal peptidase I [Thermodesulfobacteriota bacterium]